MRLLHPTGNFDLIHPIGRLCHAQEPEAKKLPPSGRQKEGRCGPGAAVGRRHHSTALHAATSSGSGGRCDWEGGDPLRRLSQSILPPRMASETAPSEKLLFRPSSASFHCSA
jgi:hypothetical protein